MLKDLKLDCLSLRLSQHRWLGCLLLFLDLKLILVYGLICVKSACGHQTNTALS